MQSSAVTWRSALAAPRVVCRDTFNGLLTVVRSSLALVGIVTLSAAAFAFARPEIRDVLADSGNELKVAVFGVAPVEESKAEVAAAAPPSSTADAPPASAQDKDDNVARRLPPEQRAATEYLSRKYRLAPDAIGVFVSEAFRAGQELKLDPLLLLAVMSIESAMNPFAQSSVGAQGLMQIMPTVHADRLMPFGGPSAALQPIANIRIGAQILKDYIQRFGSTEDGLRAYVGSALQDDDNGYGARVLGERSRLEAAVKKFTPNPRGNGGMTRAALTPTVTASSK